MSSTPENASGGKPLDEKVAAAIGKAMDTAFTQWVKVNHRQEIIIDEPIPDVPALIVGNHGFGGLNDLNIWALFNAVRKAGLQRQIVTMVHAVTWKLGPWAKVIEAGGGRPGSKEELAKAFAEGNYVLVFPGGDLDAAKPFSKRNEIHFHGRSGFARNAIQYGVPVLPIVTAGAGESLFVITDGQRLAKVLKLKDFLRMGTLPLSFSFPFGFTFGVIGATVHIPMPSKLKTAVMPLMYPEEGETPEEFAVRIERAMQDRMDLLVKGRIPFFG